MGSQDRYLDVRLLGVSDLHGHLTGKGLAYTDPCTGIRAPAGGAGALAAEIGRRRAAAPDRTVLVHSGDMIGGGPPESTMLRDEPTIRVLNLMGFDVGTPGNHEFGNGIGELLRLVRGGAPPGGGELFEGQRFPMVSANIVDHVTRQPVFPPYAVKLIGGVPIAFTGATLTLTPLLITPGGTDGVEFLDEVESVNACVHELSRRGIKAIVLLLHEGGRQAAFPHGDVSPRVADVVGALDHVDVVIAGHTHSVLNSTVNGRLVVQSSAFGKAFSDVRLVVDRDRRRVVTASASIVPVWRYSPPDAVGPRYEVPQDPAVQAVVDAARREVAPLTDQVVNTAARDLCAGRDDGATPAGESPLGNLIADAQRWATGAQFAFVNPNGIRGKLGAGTILWGDLFALQPAGNHLVTMHLTGAQIWELLGQQARVRFKRNLEVSGLHYAYRSTDSGAGVIDSVHEGPPGDTSRPVRPDAARVFTVTVNAFLAAGGDGYKALTEGRRRVTGPHELDALVNYVSGLPSPVDYWIERRIVRYG
jgi:2',3'-cyclic-nucleotide 2'-phosphodiesterase (5'-nucleotidase family)